MAILFVFAWKHQPRVLPPVLNGNFYLLFSFFENSKLLSAFLSKYNEIQKMRGIKSVCEVSKHFDEMSEWDESMNLMKFMRREKEKIAGQLLFYFFFIIKSTTTLPTRTEWERESCSSLRVAHNSLFLSLLCVCNSSSLHWCH